MDLTEYEVLRITQSVVSGGGLPEGWVSVIGYGAVGDGTTNDDAAFASAFATGYHVFIPSGTMASPYHYLLSATITPLEGQLVYMDGNVLALQKILTGSGTPYGTRLADVLSQNGSLLFTGTTNYLFDLKQHRIGLTGVQVFQHTSYVPTAGGHFKVGDGTGVYSPAIMKDGISLTNCSSYGGYRGCYVNGYIYRQNMLQCDFNQSVFACIDINLVVPAGDLHWTSIRVFAWTNDPYGHSANCVGLYVQACDTSRIDGLSIKYCKQPMWLRANSATINQLRISGLDIETADTGWSNIQIGGSGIVTRCAFTNVEVLSQEATVAWDIASNCSYNSFNQMNLMKCKYSDAGTGNILVNSDLNCLGSTSAGTGITLSGAHAIIANNRVRNRATGFSLAAGANYASVTGNNFFSNTTATSMDAAAKATGRGSANIGVADW